MNDKKMQALRLSKQEQKDINKKWIEINKVSINQGGAPVQESEFLHELIRLALPRIKVNKSNQIYLEDS